jgi:hypothetical protein
MIRRLLLVAAMTGSTVLAVGSPASASQADAIGSHITAGGTSTGVVLNGGFQAVYECTAAATGAVVSVAITGCKPSTGGRNVTIGLPGAAAVIAGTAALPLASYTLCYSATATYIDGSTRSVSGCNPLINLGGGVPAPSVGFAFN